MAVFFGHTHFPQRTIIGGIEYITVGSFAENDGNGKPIRQYVMVNVDATNINVENLLLHSV